MSKLEKLPDQSKGNDEDWKETMKKLINKTNLTQALTIIVLAGMAGLTIIGSWYKDAYEFDKEAHSKHHMDMDSFDSETETVWMTFKKGSTNMCMDPPCRNCDECGNKGEKKFNSYTPSNTPIYTVQKTQNSAVKKVCIVCDENCENCNETVIQSIITVDPGQGSSASNDQRLPNFFGCVKCKYYDNNDNVISWVDSNGNNVSECCEIVKLGRITFPVN